MLDTKAAEEGIRVVQKELAYVPGSVGMNRELYEKGFNKHCESILSCLNSIVDYVFIDCGPGYSTMNQRILNMADTVAVNLSLNEKVMDEFFQIRTFFHEKIVYLIGN